MKHFLTHSLSQLGFGFGLVCLLIPTSWAEPPTLQEGVKAYRDGQYAKALEIFTPIHEQHPEDSTITYYQAISLAQLGRFPQAKAAYEQIILLDPQSKAAQLAKQGLQFLPVEAADSLDLPPKFQQTDSAVKPNPATTAATNTNPDNSNAQDMQALQAMMMQMGMGNNNGMNNMGMSPMMYPGMFQQNGANGASSVDPNMFSTMMMNQMMQNFNMDGNKPQ